MCLHSSNKGKDNRFYGIAPVVINNFFIAVRHHTIKTITDGDSKENCFPNPLEVGKFCLVRINHVGSRHFSRSFRYKLFLFYLAERKIKYVQPQSMLSKTC